ncbi:transposase [Vibrio sp. qd031]|uniref:transposase n=1 Tax=Vibrio sp. qd031 TaxID=1603038 RepID=UPI000A0FFB0F|nr:transposase [Vibrio sp. qd031]
MTSRLRYSPVGVAQHVVQRRNNKEPCFFDREDRIGFLSRLQKYSQLYHAQIHSWVLMSNHFHLLCTPLKENGISDMMRSLSQSYVPFFNHKYQRTGKFWQGRYFSAPVESERYFLEVSRYIEMNPVRAEIVDSPDKYVWSSYRGNALGKPSTLLTEHSVYHELGSDQESRLVAYRSLFEDVLDKPALDFIRAQTQACRPIGGTDFITEIT